MLKCNCYTCISFLSALSIHQLAAQGEMVFLASRIEQGRLSKDYSFCCHGVQAIQN